MITMKQVRFDRKDLKDVSADELERLSSSEPGFSTDEAGPRQRDRKWPTIHAIIIIVYTICFALIVSMYDNSRPWHPLISSPVNKAVKNVVKTIQVDLEGTNPFRGEPRPEQTAAWYSILQHQHVVVQAEDLAKINRTSVKLMDGSGYLAIVAVSHQLHCLNYLREYIHRDYYNKETDEGPKSKKRHIDHCIDNLRQVLMCHGDVALETFDWIPDYRWPWPNFKMDHECRDWNSIQNWIKEHEPPTLRGSVLQHPELGIVYPEE